MISGGHATVYVSNMDNAVRFYTDVLGLRLKMRHEDHFAMVDAGPGLTIALHPITAAAPAPPGTPGSVQIGLDIDEPIERVVARLQRRGARITSDVITFEGGKCVTLEDADGNAMYLWERRGEEAGEVADQETSALSR